MLKGMSPIMSPDIFQDKLFPLLVAKAGNANNSGWLPLWAHLLDTAGIMEKLVLHWLPASVAQVICERNNLPDIRQLCVFLAAIHDIGKATPLFQSRILQQTPEIRQKLAQNGLKISKPSSFNDQEQSPHALAGELILLHMGCPEGIASIVGAHHGKPAGIAIDPEKLQLFEVNYYSADGCNSIQGQQWEMFWQICLELALQEAGYSGVEDLPEIDEESQVLLAGLLIMADWLASNTTYFPLIDQEYLGQTLRYPDRIDTAWRTIHLPDAWTPCCFFMDEEQFAQRFNFYPYPAQKQVLDIIEKTVQPGIFILEAPMGTGKTESALGAAEILASKTGCGGLFFGLPTQATANGLFPRLEQWAAGQSENTRLGIRLAHGMAALNQDYQALFQGQASLAEDNDSDSGLVAHYWFEGRKQSLLADFVIGTIDQLLLAALRQKHVMMRHLGLAGKVVIIDECHAYDAYMNCYLDRTLNWLGAYQIPVFMLSATLPAKRRTELIMAYLNRKKCTDIAPWQLSQDYPLITWTEADGVHQCKLSYLAAPRTIYISRQDETVWMDSLEKALQSGVCAGVIVNTVRRAQDIAQQLREKMPEKDVLLLHSRFTLADRAKQETELLHRSGKSSTAKDRDGLIVVGTQVLEQSLDIDFDILVSDLCPMDLLLQRIGRLHRHQRLRPKDLAKASCIVLNADGPLESGAEKIYSKYLLLRTRQLLPEKMLLPNDISPLVQATYFNMDDSSDAVNELKQEWDNYQKHLKKKKRDADNFLIDRPQMNKETLHGWLDTPIGDNESIGLAKVRDGADALEVLLMMKRDDGRVTFFPWQNDGAEVAHDHLPSEEECLMIAQQRIALPRQFNNKNTMERAIAELEADNQDYLSEWQRSHLLKGELILLFDENYQASLCGYQLVYSQKNGLMIEKEG